MIDAIELLKDFTNKYVNRAGKDNLLAWYIKQPNAEKIAYEAITMFNEVYKRLWYCFSNDSDIALQELIALTTLFFNCGKLNSTTYGYGENSVMVLRKFIKLSSRELTYFLHIQDVDDAAYRDQLMVELHCAYLTALNITKEAE